MTLVRATFGCELAAAASHLRKTSSNKLLEATGSLNAFRISVDCVRSLTVDECSRRGPGSHRAKANILIVRREDVMTTSQEVVTGTSTQARRIGFGVVAGIVAGAAMAMYAMVAGATYLGTGFFTPLYHIASPLIGGEPMNTSMESAMSDGNFYFEGGPAVAGLAIHMGWSMLFGAAFALIAGVARVRRGAAIVAGVVYGLGVMAIMSLLTLPVTAEVVGGGKAVEEMPTMVGWTSFTIEHALFGFILGVWVALRPQQFLIDATSRRSVERRSRKRATGVTRGDRAATCV